MKHSYQLKMKGNKRPAFAVFLKENENVEGINWELLNDDRFQIGNRRINEPTIYNK